MGQLNHSHKDVVKTKVLDRLGQQLCSMFPGSL